MHTSSLSGTITVAIYSDIFPWGILVQKQLHFECVRVHVRVCVGGTFHERQSDLFPPIRQRLKWTGCLLFLLWRPVADSTWQRHSYRNANPTEINVLQVLMGWGPVPRVMCCTYLIYVMASTAILCWPHFLNICDLSILLSAYPNTFSLPQ